MSRFRASLSFATALLLGVTASTAQRISAVPVDDMLRKMPAKFSPAAMPYLLDLVVGNATPSSLEALHERLRKRPDLVEIIERLDEAYLEHRRVLIPLELELEAVRDPRYRSPIARLAEDLARKLPELADAPADTALRAVGRELARSALKPDVAPSQIENVLAGALQQQDPKKFLKNAESLLAPGFLAQGAWRDLAPDTQADLVRNALAGALVGDNAGVVHFTTPPPLKDLLEMGREALKAHERLLVEENEVLATVEASMEEQERTLLNLQKKLELRRDEVVQEGQDLLKMLASPERAKAEAVYRQAYDELIRAQSFVEALAAGDLSLLAQGDPAAAVEKLIPRDLQGLAAEIRKVAAAPQKIAGEVERLLDTGQKVMQDLDAFVKDPSHSLALEVQVGAARFDAGAFAIGIFEGCFDAAVVSSGLTLDLGNGRLDVGALVGGLAGNDLLGALGASSLTVDVAGVPVDVVGLATNLATGNFLGAVGGLLGGSGSPFGGLFGGGGGGSEMREIKKQLAQIQQTLEQIVRQLAQIERKIDLLREEVRQAHQETMARLDALSLDLSAIRLANAAFFRAQAASCQVLADALSEASYEKVRRTIWDSLFLEVESCHKYTLRTPSTKDVPPAIRLLLNENDDAVEARKNLRDHYLKPHLDLLTQSLGVRQRRRAPELLLDTRPTIDSARARAARLDGPGVGDSYRRTEGKKEIPVVDAVLDGVFEVQQIVDTGPLSELVDHVLRMEKIAPYYNVRERWIVTPGCVLEGKGCVAKWEPENWTVSSLRLGNTLRLVNTALAQQALFNGDLLLPAASATLGAAPDSPGFTTLKAVLSGNPVLASNLTHFVLRERLEKRRGFRARASQYALARLYAEKTDGDTSFAELLFPDIEGSAPEISFFFHAPDRLTETVERDLKTRCGDRLPGPRGIYAVLPGPLCVPIPGQEAFARGILEVTPAWSRAAALRERLLDEILGYTFREILSPEDRKLYDQLQILNRSLSGPRPPEVSVPAPRKGP